jgi:methionine-rich copper-binding protein CopC
MRSRETRRRRWRRMCCVVAAILLSPAVADARALHVRESTPAAEAIITGRHAEYVIRFDGLVDHRASRMQIMQSGRVVQTLVPLGDSAPDVLFASGEAPRPGKYVLRWRAISAGDGVASNGDIRFSVAP